MVNRQRARWTVLGLGAWLAVAPLAAQSDSEAAAHRVLLQAQRYEQQGNFDEALNEYRVLVSEFPRSSQAPIALLQSARLRSTRGEAQAAFDTAQQLIDGYGRHPAAASAWVLQGEVRVDTARSLDHLEEAHGFFRRAPLLFLRQAYPLLESRSAALVRSGEISLLLGKEDEAAAAFLEAIEDELESSWTPRARLGLASVWMRQGEWAAAAELLQRVVDRGARSENPADAHTTKTGRERLTLLHRLYLRPLASQKRWTRARQLGVSGLALKRPSGVASDKDGRLLVVDNDSDTVVLDPEGNVQTRGSYRGVGHPWFDFDGQAYVPTGDGIQRVGGGLTTFTLSGDKPKQLNKLQAGERGIFDDWMLVDREIDGVASFDRNERYLGATAAGELPETEDVAVDARGRLHALDRRERKVVVLGLDQRVVGRISGGWRRPIAVDVDFLGNVYVLDRNTSSVSVFSADGAPITSLGPALPGGGLELRNPEDLAVDGAGRIYIADSRLSALIVVE